jgi:long-chain fatty acid transport protein
MRTWTWNKACLNSTNIRLTNFFRFSGNGWSVGYNLGLLWQPIDENFDWRHLPQFGDGHSGWPDGIEQTHSYRPRTNPPKRDFKFPLTVVFGISYRPTPKWNLEFDADYTDWSSFGSKP